MPSEDTTNRITLKEAAQIAHQILDDSERLRQESYAKEAAFERRRAFGEYGEAAILMMLDKGSGDPEMDDDGMSNADFEDKYGVSKQSINLVLWKLQIAIDKGDYTWRNEVYDFFTEILR